MSPTIPGVPLTPETLYSDIIIRPDVPQGRVFLNVLHASVLLVPCPGSHFNSIYEYENVCKIEHATCQIYAKNKMKDMRYKSVISVYYFA